MHFLEIPATGLSMKYYSNIRWIILESFAQLFDVFFVVAVMLYRASSIKPLISTSRISFY